VRSTTNIFPPTLPWENYKSPPESDQVLDEDGDGDPAVTQLSCFGNGEVRTSGRFCSPQSSMASSLTQVPWR
jgi:hypothetical protein